MSEQMGDLPCSWALAGPCGLMPDGATERYGDVHSCCIAYRCDASDADARDVNHHVYSCPRHGRNGLIFGDSYSFCGQCRLSTANARITELERECARLKETSRLVEAAVYEGNDYRFTWDPIDLPAMIRNQREAHEALTDGWYNKANASDARIERLSGALKELLRLYDWRKEIAQYEATVADHVLRDPIGPCTNCQTTREKIRRDLLKYGREKAAAWIAARKELAEMEGK